MSWARIATATLDLLFPPVCLFCFEPLGETRETGEVRDGPHHRFCSSCYQDLTAKEDSQDLASGLREACGDHEACEAVFPRSPYPDQEACPRCAAPLRGGRCPYCAQRNYAFDESYALGLYQETLQEAVLRSKQARFESLTLGLGRLLGKHLATGGVGPTILGSTRRPSLRRPAKLALEGNPTLNRQGFDWTVAIPSYWTRRLNRGVHSAGLIAEGVAAEVGVPLAFALQAIRKTEKQGTLEPHQRFPNVRDVFRATKRYDFTGARLLLVDDVMTTGATLHEAARTLKRAGAARIGVAVVARGTG